MSEESVRLLTQLLDILGKLAESLKADIVKDSAPRPWWKEGAKVKAEDVEVRLPRIMTGVSLSQSDE